MSIFEPSRSPWTDRMLSILRIVAGLVFVVTGTMKLFGFPPMPAQVPAMPVVPPMWEFHLAGIPDQCEMLAAHDRPGMAGSAGRRQGQRDEEGSEACAAHHRSS